MEIIIDRLKREFKVEAEVGKPQVPKSHGCRSRVASGVGEVGRGITVACTGGFGWKAPWRSVAEKMRKLDEL